ncbi:hypothetical protein BH23ACT9_BH23ACT9_05670 [soil metagenome]
MTQSCGVAGDAVVPVSGRLHASRHTQRRLDRTVVRTDLGQPVLIGSEAGGLAVSLDVIQAEGLRPRTHLGVDVEVAGPQVEDVVVVQHRLARPVLVVVDDHVGPPRVTDGGEGLCFLGHQVQVVAVDVGAAAVPPAVARPPLGVGGRRDDHVAGRQERQQPLVGGEGQVTDQRDGGLAARRFVAVLGRDDIDRRPGPGVSDRPVVVGAEGHQVHRPIVGARAPDLLEGERVRRCRAEEGLEERQLLGGGGPRGTATGLERRLWRCGGTLLSERGPHPQAWQRERPGRGSGGGQSLHEAAPVQGGVVGEGVRRGHARGFAAGAPRSCL